MFVGLYKLARDAKERRGILAMIPLFLGAIAFFAIFEQAPTTLSIFAKDFTAPDFLGFFEPSYYQSINAIFIIRCPRLRASGSRLLQGERPSSSSVCVAWFCSRGVRRHASDVRRHEGTRQRHVLTVLDLFNRFTELFSPVAVVYAQLHRSVSGRSCACF